MRLLPKRKKKPVERRRTATVERTSTASYSYYAQQRSEQTINTGRQLNREQLQVKARHFGSFWLQRFGLATLLIVAVICAIATLSLSSQAKIVPLSSSASQAFLQPTAVYQAAADQILGSSIWNRNKLTVDTGRLSRQLQSQFPELTTVTVNLPLLEHRPLVYIQPAKPALLLVEGSSTYAVDETGRVLINVASDSSLTKLGLPVVTDQSGLQIKLGKPTLTTDDVSFVQVVVEQLAAKHFTPSAMSLPPEASELDVHLVGQPYYIKFNLEDNDPLQQVGTFLATQAHLAGQNITPAQYVDVRLDGRAYYQ